ncbi:hypothetical protein VMCG_04149 [Cytospora schulzeri]|uniref:Uncharacterized protein n=1 Tax=Cytospora schulzeri TaxID=448051 RepID=A0A423WTH8_9PEZI|nr:hypothetical protein VMCG_04149 [Valsa malicola]
MSISDGKPNDSMVADCGLTDLEVEHFKKGTGTFHITVAIRDMKEVQSFTEKVVEIWVGSGFEHSRYFSAVALPNDEAGMYISGRPLLEDLRSHKALDQARSWIRECTLTHDACSNSNKEDFFPLRIIDVDRYGQGDAKSSRVFVTSKIPNSNTDVCPGYAALSYSWGGEANFVSTMKTINSFEEDGIEIKNLPQTVQDAIFCTKQIGLRYLWVDALCIIQDDSSDKRRQIPQIRSTFHFSTVTIVASRSKTVYDGFLGKPRSTRQKSGPLPYYSPSGSTVGTFHLVQTYIHEYSDDPVNERAWTLEEALLSPRLLIYSACGLLWQCQEGNDVACQGAGNHVTFGARNAHYRLPRSIFQGGSSSCSTLGSDASVHAEEALESARIAWAACLRLYTSRKLTRESDKLQALSGLAEQYALFFLSLPATHNDSGLRDTSDYFAGLWRHQMPQALTWRRDLDTELTPRPRTYRAPSWSWASIDGMIHLASLGEVYNFEILQLHVPLHNPAYSFGRVPNEPSSTSESPPPTKATKGCSLTDLPPQIRLRIWQLVCPEIEASAREKPRVLEVEIVRCPCDDHVCQGPCISSGIFLREQHRYISILLSINHETRELVDKAFPDVFPIGHEKYENEYMRHCKRGLVRFDSQRDIVMIHENSEIRGDPTFSFTANKDVRDFSWSGIRYLALGLRGGSPRTISSTLKDWSKSMLFEIQQGIPDLERFYLAWDMELPDWSHCNFHKHYTLSLPSKTPWVPTDPIIQYWWSPLSAIQNHSDVHQGSPLTARQLEDFQTDRILEGWSITEKGKLRQLRFKMDVMHVQGYDPKRVYPRPVQHPCECDLVPAPSCLREGEGPDILQGA